MGALTFIWGGTHLHFVGRRHSPPVYLLLDGVQWSRQLRVFRHWRHSCYSLWCFVVYVWLLLTSCYWIYFATRVLAWLFRIPIRQRTSQLYYFRWCIIAFGPSHNPLCLAVSCTILRLCQFGILFTVHCINNGSRCGWVGKGWRYICAVWWMSLFRDYLKR